MFQWEVAFGDLVLVVLAINYWGEADGPPAEARCPGRGGSALAPRTPRTRRYCSSVTEAEPMRMPSAKTWVPRAELRIPATPGANLTV